MEPSQPPDNEPFRTYRPEGNPVLAEWEAAIISFHRCYNQLISYVDDYNAQQKLSMGPIHCVGQCPIRQLTAVLTKMHGQLNKLILDIDQSDQAGAGWTIQKLVAHTRLLNRLNQQALVVIQLASQPAS